MLKGKKAFKELAYSTKFIILKERSKMSLFIETICIVLFLQGKPELVLSICK